MRESVRKLVASRPEAMQSVASEILAAFPNLRIFALFGPMGAGKTTLIQSFCKVLGVEGVVSSPTFSLVNEYTTQQDETIFHFDFYRIEKIEEVYDIGYEEYVYSGAYCFMEWPEKITELLPDSYVYISIEENENRERIVSFVAK